MLKNRIIYSDFSEWIFDVSKAKGSYIWDKEGNKLLDFTSGWNVTNLGWNHPEITEAIIKQVRKNTYVPMWTADSVQNEYADALARSLPKELGAIGRATGGTEANEEAIKTARAYTRRKKIIGFKDTYHGQSFATLAIGYLPEYVESILPLTSGFVQLDFPKIYGTSKSPKEILADFTQNLEKVLAREDVAAVVTEAGIITGWGSTYVAPRGYLKIVRKLTKKYGTLLILDEVGTGFSRCGKLFGMELENVVPDIATFAKGLSNGAAAIGAMVTTTEIAKRIYDKINLTSTFGWTPIACAAALKTLKIHKQDKVWQKAKKDGEYLMNSLKQKLADDPRVKDIRGIGMEVGIELVKDKKIKGIPLVDRVVESARKKGLHLVCDHASVIQLMPPLIISRKDLDQGIDILINLIKTS